MDELITTTTYTATVGPGHIVALPATIPVGSQVMITLLSPEAVVVVEAERRARFGRVMAAIQAAIANGYTGANISDEELDALITRARYAANHH